jgi:hypothetical protein
MKTPHSFRNKAAPKWVIQKASRITVSPLVASLFFAFILTAFAGLVAVRLSQEYYSVGPHHYDSAFYRLIACQFYNLFQSQGLSTALAQALQSKDSLDIITRLLLAPRLLLHPYGHLSVLLPFMGLFILLVINYVFTRTHSWICGIAIVGFLFSFPIIYNPMVIGIADYWKDNLATWLMGSAVMSFILSRSLAYRRASFLSGLLLGLLTAQRSALAIYAALLFLPLFLWAVYQRIRTDDLKAAILRIGVFLTPAVLLSGFIFLMQWQMLYNYYFVKGYDYASPLQVAQMLLLGSRERIGFSFFLIVGICLLCSLRIKHWKHRANDILIASWLVVGLPLVVSITRCLYSGFHAVWTILLIVLLATFFSSFLESVKSRRIFILGLLFVAIGSSFLQYAISVVLAHERAAYTAPLRRFNDDLTNIIMALPKPHEVIFLHDEAEGPFLNHVLFNRHIPLTPQEGITFVGFMSIHDSYYRAAFGNVSVRKIVDTIISNLEQHPGTIAVAYCDPSDVQTNLAFQPDGKNVATPVAISLTSHVMHSLHWKALTKLDSPYGCLYVYQYCAQPMTGIAKWRELSFGKTLDELPLTLSVAPGVRMYAYQSRYKAEIYNGIYCQWLPSGGVGLRLMLFSDKARTVLFQTRALAGPSRKDSVRTLMVTKSWEAPNSIQISQEQDITLKLNLNPGLNQINFSVKESPECTIQPNGDTRELMLLLVSPRLLPGHL